MEYVPGGDFRTLLNNSGVLKEEHARFYISEMFASVCELHKLGYIHRDLKPEVCRQSIVKVTLYHHLPIALCNRTFLWTLPATSNSQISDSLPVLSIQNVSSRSRSKFGFILLGHFMARLTHTHAARQSKRQPNHTSLHHGTTLFISIYSKRRSALR
jgi:Protein kinase domain